MPAIAVVGAVGAIAIAAEVGTTVAIVAAVGATVAAVGAVTGVKELAIAGGVIGAVGAIGGIASAAGAFGSAASTAGSAGGAVAPLAQGAGEAAGAAGTVASSGVEAASSAAGAAAGAGETAVGVAGSAPYANVGELMSAQGIGGEAGLATNVIDTVAGVPSAPSTDVAQTTSAFDPTKGLISQPPTEPQVAAVEAPTPPGLIEQGGGEGGSLGVTGNPAAVNGGVATPQSPAAPDASGTGVTETTGIAATSNQPNQLETLLGSPAPKGAPSTSDSSTWAGIRGFLKDNPGLLKGLLQAGGSFMSGATDSLKPAQVDALRARADLDRRQNDLLAFQMSNMQQPIPKATRRRGNGLINQQRA